MKKILFLLTMVALLTTGCANEFNRVYKTTDYSYKYDYAKECFARGKYTQAVTLLTDLVVVQKGTDNAEECLYMLAMAEYCNKNYQTASEVFKSTSRPTHEDSMQRWLCTMLARASIWERLSRGSTSRPRWLP